MFILLFIWAYLYMLYVLLILVEGNMIYNNKVQGFTESAALHTLLNLYKAFFYIRLCNTAQIRLFLQVLVFI